MEEFLLANGVEVSGDRHFNLPIAEVTGIAEEVYTQRPSKTKMYTWFSEVLAVSIRNIGETNVSSDFLKTYGTTREVPKIVKKLSFVDAGTLLLQVHRSCWEDILADQEITCEHCNNTFNADIDLNKIEVPEPLDEPVTEIVVKLSKDYKIPDNDSFAEFKDDTYNQLKFRVPNLEDAIRNEGVSSNEVMFWRKLCFDTLEAVEDNNGTDVLEIPSKFKAGRGSLLFKSDLLARDLKKVRSELQRAIPSAMLFYKDTCKICKEETRYFANVNSFFLA